MFFCKNRAEKWHVSGCSEPGILSNYFLIDVHVLVCNLLHHIVNDLLELGGPHRVQLVQFLVSRNAVRGQLGDEILRGLCVLLGLDALRFGGGLAVFFALVRTRLSLLNRRE